MNAESPAHIRADSLNTLSPVTTYRLMAEQTVDQVVRWLKTSGGRFGPCRTAEQELLPIEETDGFSGIRPAEFNRRSVEHFCRKEWAVHLEDVMIRRSGWHYYYASGADSMAEQVAAWMSEILEWTEAEQANELARYEAIGHGDLGAACPAESGTSRRPLDFVSGAGGSH